MADILLEIGLIIGIAAVLTIIARLIKQPPIISYLITGILVGPLAFNILKSTELIQTFAHLGIAFLLFIIGLSLDLRVLKEVGGIAALAGIGEIIIVSGISFLIATAFGFGKIPALYIAAALAFSSAVVVVKLLSDKKEMDTLHGKIALGIIIVEHFIAAIFLMIMPVLGTGNTLIILSQFGKAILFTIFLFVFAHFVLYRALNVMARNQDVLFLFSVAWALLIAMLFDYFGFSIEIGALLAGMSLAQSPYSFEMTGKIKGLRDFFVVSFFVFFGSQLLAEINGEMIKQVLIFSAFILIGKPLFVMACMKVFGGYKKRINFLAGISLAQISEMSLVLILLGYTLGFVEQTTMSMIILVALVTIAASSYSIYYSSSIFKKISGILNIFDGKKKELKYVKSNEYEIILFGYNRVGFSLLKAFKAMHKKYLVVDYNPETILHLSNKGIDCVYGDAEDIDLLEDLPIHKAKIIISTISELRVNLSILDYIKGKNILFIPTSQKIEDSLELYKEGANYVILPHLLGGDYMAHMLVKEDFSKKNISSEGKKQVKELTERLQQIHDYKKRNLIN